MFIKSQIDSALDREITAALEELKTLRDDPEKYSATAERVAKLQKVRSERELDPRIMETMLICATNLFGVLWLARFEKEHVIKAKEAFRFVMRAR